MIVKTEITQETCVKTMNKDHGEVKEKNYRVKKEELWCECCEVYCNSVSQLNVHMISKKHRDILVKPLDNEEVVESDKTKEPEHVVTKTCETPEEIRARSIGILNIKF